MAAAFVELPFQGRTIRLEYAWVGVRTEQQQVPRRYATRDDNIAATAAPLVIFLHEGLGSVAMWKDWPEQLCAAAGYRGLVYSRYGYGRSTPRPPEERWTPDFMHVQAQDTLPRLLAALQIGAGSRKPWLFGHSDGASIALIHASTYAEAVAGVIAVAPHIMVEDVSIRSIERAGDAYRTTDLRQRLGRYHADPDSAFWGWNDIWLDPAFRTWSIEAMLPHLRCPVLAIQGVDDEYGTLAQVTGIRRQVPHAELVVLEDCGHSPHRDRPDALAQAVTDFISRHEVALDNQGGTQ
jgi:pimeloyl-ACP methyl ester carboxylesterase